MSDAHITQDDSHAPTPLISAWWASHGAGDRYQLTPNGVFDAGAATLYDISISTDPATKDAYAGDLANAALMAELPLAMAAPTAAVPASTIGSEPVPVVEAVPTPPAVPEPVTLAHLQPATPAGYVPPFAPEVDHVMVPAAHAQWLLTLEHAPEALWEAVKRLFGHL